MAKMRFITILFIFHLIGLFVFVSLAIAEQRSKEVAVRVNVGVDKNSRQVKSVQIGEHGRFLTTNQITQTFGAPGNPIVTMQDFEKNKTKLNNQIKPQASHIYLNNGTSKSTTENMLNYIDKTAQYMASQNLSFDAPRRIILGENNTGDYATKDTWNLSTISGSVFKEVVTSKVIQSSLLQNHPNLGYQGNEAFSRYFTYDCLGKTEKGNHTYSPDLQGLTGNDIYQAYVDYNAGKITKVQLDQLINNTANNNLAMTEAMLEVGNANTAFNALNYLRNSNNPDGSSVKQAFITADKGKNTYQIDYSFNRHGIK